VSKCLDFLHDGGPLLRHIKVPYEFDCPRIEDLLNSRSSSGGIEILYLGDTVYTYVVPSGELSGQIKDVLERRRKTSAQVIEGLDGIANRWDDYCEPFNTVLVQSHDEMKLINAP